MIPHTSIILSTYNQPEWLTKVLWGYVHQTDPRFEIVIADDGSDERTADLIKRTRRETDLLIRHVWHPDDGFRKCAILNKASLQTDTDYLVFSDGDCIPRGDFVAAHHRHRRRGYFLSGGYYKLPMELSNRISLDDIAGGAAFKLSYLRSGRCSTITSGHPSANTRTRRSARKFADDNSGNLERQQRFGLETRPDRRRRL